MGFVALAACGPAQPSGTPEKQGEPPSIDINDISETPSTDYYLAFDENAVSAKSRFSSWPFIITGKVNKIEAANILQIDDKYTRSDDLKSFAEVHLAVVDGNYYPEVVSIVSDSTWAATLKRGDEVALLCRSVADIPLNSPADCEDAYSLGWKKSHGDTEIDSRPESPPSSTEAQAEQAAE